MPEWLKLSAPYYAPEASEAALQYLAGAPENRDPEAPRAAFEAAVARHLGVPPEWVLATNSCTAALTLACRLLDQGSGIEAPVLTWPATYAHARHHLVDVSQDAPPRPVWTDDEFRLRVPVALWGRPVPPVSHRRVIVDSAHAFGAHIDQLQRSDVAAVCYSFGPLKEVPCSRGGALVSSCCASAAWRAAADSGTRGRHALAAWGGNFEMGEPECVLGLHQLAHAREWYEARQATLRAYQVYWSDSRAAYTGRLLTLPGEASGHVCVAVADTPQIRELWRAALLSRHIECGVHYELPLWAPASQWPVAWEWSQRILSLPMHLGVCEADVDEVCAALAGAVT